MTTTNEAEVALRCTAELAALRERLEDAARGVKAAGAEVERCERSGRWRARMVGRCRRGRRSRRRKARSPMQRRSSPSWGGA
jgi:hypothetical protein